MLRKFLDFTIEIWLLEYARGLIGHVIAKFLLELSYILHIILKSLQLMLVNHLDILPNLFNFLLESLFNVNTCNLGIWADIAFIY